MTRRRPFARAVLAALALAALGAGDLAAIEGGAYARAGDRLARSTVGIGTLVDGDNGLGATRCSGVLIAPDRVLTAAHCIGSNALAALVVFYEGRRVVEPIHRVVGVARYDVPEDFPEEFAAQLRQLSLDTAVLRLAAPIRGRAPVRIANGSRRPPGRLRLAGAGLSSEGSGILKTTWLDPVAFTSTGLTIARARGSLVCTGDSGGPVVFDGPRGPVLWGVASAVLTSSPPCGNVVVIAPAAPNFGG